MGVDSKGHFICGYRKCYLIESVWRKLRGVLKRGLYIPLQKVVRKAIEHSLSFAPSQAQLFCDIDNSLLRRTKCIVRYGCHGGEDKLTG